MDRASRRLSVPGDLPLLARFYDELYLPAFAHQREPREVWEARLADAGAPYRLMITVAGADLDDARAARLDGGVACEWYPRSRCGLVTYLVVAPGARRGGLGRRLLDDARAALAAHAAATGAEVAAVFGEVADPEASDDPEAAARLARFRRWGARLVDARYVQPALGAGLTRDRHLRLIAFDPPGARLDGAVLAGFLREFYAVTEGGDPDADRELAAVLGAIGPTVALR